MVVSLSHFFIEYKDPLTLKVVRDLKKIFWNHVLGWGFITDVLPLIPFYLFVNFRRARYLYIIKVMRLYEAYLILNVKEWFRQIKAIRKKSREDRCKVDEEYANDQI